MLSSRFLNIREESAMEEAIHEVYPNRVVHLAAQAFVLEGYWLLFETFDININETINVLESCEESKNE